MDIGNLITFLIVGAIAGFLASHLMRSRGFGLLGNMIAGIIGSVVGGFLFALVGITFGGILGSIISATVGAAVVLALVGAIKKL